MPVHQGCSSHTRLQRPRSRSPHAFTLLELICVMAAITLLASILAPRVGALLDGVAVRGAIDDADAVLAAARQLALTRGERVVVDIDTSASTLVLRAGPDTIRRRDERALNGVRLAATRPSVTYTPLGLALASSNLTLIASRRGSADTLTVSRLGRVRR